MRFPDEVLEGLGLDRALFMAANSPGSLWASWMALEGTGKVEKRVNMGCPKVVLDTSDPFHLALTAFVEAGGEVERNGERIAPRPGAGRAVGRERKAVRFSTVVSDTFRG